MLWEGNSTPEWVDGAGLANSDAVSTEMLSEFLATQQVRWVSKAGTVEGTPNSVAAEQAAQGLSAGNADSVEGATGGTGGDVHAGHDASLDHGDQVAPDEQTAGVGGGIVGEEPGGVATAEVRDGDNTAVVGHQGEVAVGHESSSQVAEGEDGTGALGNTGEVPLGVEPPAVAVGQPDSAQMSAPGIGTLGNAGSTGVAGEHAGEERKDMEVQESSVWATATLSDINLLTVSWEGNITGDAVQVDECEDFVFQITS